MRYALLICQDEEKLTTATPEEAAENMAAYEAFMAKVGDRLLGGERLRPTTESTTVRVRDDEVLTADGPFAETKEQVCGFFVVQASDLDEAIEIASQLPGARAGCVEVRPIWDM